MQHWNHGHATAALSMVNINASDVEWIALWLSFESMQHYPYNKHEYVNMCASVSTVFMALYKCCYYYYYYRRVTG